jgi:hypothetical protein
MKTYEESAYAVAALGAAGVAIRLFIRLLLSKGLVGRDEAVRALLDEAVSRAIFAETGARGEIEAEMNRQSAEILKFMAQDL